MSVKKNSGNSKQKTSSSITRISEFAQEDAESSSIAELPF
jgi:hypothetical protein